MSDSYGELDELFIKSKDQSVQDLASPASLDVPISNSCDEHIPHIHCTKNVSNDTAEIKITSKTKQNKPKKVNKKNKTYDEIIRERTRIRAQQFRDKRKAEFLESLKYSESLQKQNKKLKQQISLLKQQLNKLIIHCKHQNIL